MSDVSFEQMLEESFKSIHIGEVVTGVVLDVKPSEAILNIGYKSDGVLTAREYSNEEVEDLSEFIKVGDELDVKVLKLNDSEGQVALSYKRVLAEKGNEVLKAAFENEEVLEAKVFQVLSGGLSVVVEGVKIFIPASLVSDTYERDLSKYKDQLVKFVITEFNPRRNRIIASRKKLIIEEKKKLRDELLARVGIGDTVEGTVKNLTDFGAFIDLGGVDGLLHISEMTWGKIVNPKTLLSIGDKVKVFIKDIREEKIALSMKFPEENPWKIISEKYKVGDVIKGKVARMTEFGAFIEIENGIDGLLHVSQISYEHVSKPADVLKVGQEVEVKIVDISATDHKISLSMKALLEPPVKPESSKENEKTDDSQEEVVDVDIEEYIANEETEETTETEEVSEPVDTSESEVEEEN